MPIDHNDIRTIRQILSKCSQEELTMALEQAGFAVKGVYDAFTRSKPEENSERIQFVAQKTSEIKNIQQEK